MAVFSVSLPARGTGGGAVAPTLIVPAAAQVTLISLLLLAVLPDGSRPRHGSFVLFSVQYFRQERPIFVSMHVGISLNLAYTGVEMESPN